MAGLNRITCLLRQFHGTRSIYSSSVVLQNATQGSTTETSESKSISKAMKVYLERAKKHDEFVQHKLAEYNIGKRHLANMMGRDPEFFTQKDVDEAIAYLFPSGLFDPRARPMLKHPDEIFPKRKAAEFDASGRPFHTLFYTAKPHYYSLLHDAASKVQHLNDYEDKLIIQGKNTVTPESLNLSGSEWLPKLKLEAVILESIRDDQYGVFVKTMERLAQHKFASLENEFIMKYRRSLTQQTDIQEIPKLLTDDSGRPYITQTGTRKRSSATVTVKGRGSGSFKINDEDILYFSGVQEREQVLFPLQFTGLLGKVDVEAKAVNGGPSGQAGAIRYAISLCLRSFVDAQMMEKMRLAGLLTRDPRHCERKKPGQEGARRKYTWKKR